MCTLTWVFSSNGSYSLIFNRDELKTRQRAIPPALKQSQSGVSYLAPTDSDAGGTWLAVNQFGVTICLLNHYLAPEPEGIAIRSRGEVVTDLADSDSLSRVEAGLQSMNLCQYRGFEIVAFHNSDVWHWRWDTLQLTRLEAVMPITSSSYETETVQKIRSDHFARVDDTYDIEALERFHSCHLDDELHEVDGQPIAVSSVCMHRSYAETVSQCLVEVSSEAVSIRYTDGSPCSTLASSPVLLNRRAVA